MPSGQGAHVDAFVAATAALHVLRGQGVHAPAPGEAEKLPGSQGWHLLEPAGATNPAGQVRHVARDVAFQTGDAVPAGQEMQAACV